MSEPVRELLWLGLSALAAGAINSIVGGYVGARVARRIRPQFVRRFIVVVGLGLSAYYFYKQFA